jgi:hypothetical protein
MEYAFCDSHIQLAVVPATDYALGGKSGIYEATHRLG